jgi:adenosylcobinamide kinase/adenosylcobinamide-phosphate guanylyltransferase
MFVLYFGGQKSCKSKLSEEKAIKLSKTKPYYIATYDNNYGDYEMIQRVQKHQLQREDKFITIEQMQDLTRVIKENETYLIDCISMWIFNNINQNEDILLQQLSTLSKLNTNIVFVLNDIGSSIVPLEKQTRKFIDLTGTIGQKLTSFCNEVYEVKFGLERRLK